MTPAWIFAIIGLPLGGLAAALAISLRNLSTRRLEECAGKNGGLAPFEPILRAPVEHGLSMGAVRVICSVTTAISIALLFNPLSPAPTDDGATATLAWNTPMLLLGGLIAALLIYIFHVAIPVAIAEHAGEPLVYRTRPLIRALHIALTPLRVLGFIEPAIRRLAGADARTDAEELEDEILSVVSEGERGGHVKEAEREMIEAVVQFWSTTVEEIMTPRTEIEGFQLTNDLGFIRDFIRKAGHSRIPVYEESLDNIVGVLYAKDLLNYLGTDTSDFDLRSILRPGTFVPESKLISELLVELQTRKVHLAVVIDEYGGTTGLVTVEDLLEEIVGEIQDEHEPEHESPPAIAVDVQTRSAEIEARAYIEDANDELESIGIELPEAEDYDTVGGFIITTLGHIPVVGEVFRQNGWAITILEAEPTRVQKLRIEIVEEDPDANAAQPTEQDRRNDAEPDPSSDPDHPEPITNAER
ncbi:MAG: hemolysin family protein [Phycisphaerales bacterium]